MIALILHIWCMWMEQMHGGTKEISQRVQKTRWQAGLAGGQIVDATHHNPEKGLCLSSIFMLCDSFQQL